MRISGIVFALGFFFVFVCPLCLLADDEDSEQEASQVTLIIQPSFRLGIIDGDVSKSLPENPGADSAFDTGYIEFDASKPNLIVNANKTWKLSAKTSGFTGPYDKAAQGHQLQNLAAEHSAISSYVPLTAEDQEIASYAGGVKDEEHPCQYRILLDWGKDVPGTYEATVTYTLATSGA